MQYAGAKAKEREAELKAREERLEVERAAAEKAAKAERAAVQAERKRLEAMKKENDEQRKHMVEMIEAQAAADYAARRAREEAAAVAAAEAAEEAASREALANEAAKEARAARVKALEEEKQRSAVLAQEAMEKRRELEARHKQVQERTGLPLDLAQSVAHMQNEVERGILEQKRGEQVVNARAAAASELDAQAKEQSEKLEVVRREIEAAKKCSLSAQYTQAEQRLLLTFNMDETLLKPTSYDWIGVFSVNNLDPKKYHTYISTESRAQFTYECALPTEPGLYICLFFHGKQHELVASSDQIFLGPSLEMVATPDYQRKIITMNFEVKTGNPSPKDWIAFYRSDKPDRQYIEYKWLKPGVFNGAWEVKMPRRGGYDYEFRFFSHTMRKPMKLSNKVRLPKEDELKIKSHDVLDRETRHEVSWTIVSVDPTNWDWIELVSHPDNKRITWNYIDSNALHSSFTAPKTPGRYYYRYWARSIGSGPVAQSPVFEVANRDKLNIHEIDGVLHVTHDVLSVDNNQSCWIGLYDASNPDAKYLNFQYIPAPAEDNSHRTLKFTKPGPGSYEARFFSSTDKHKPVIISPTLAVQ